ncbi:hypothetical protein HDU82_007658, partial [Entophlyctis luteolus]
MLGVDERYRSISTTSIALANDSFLYPESLNISSELTAYGCVYLAMRLHNLYDANAFSSFCNLVQVAELQLKNVVDVELILSVLQALTKVNL